MNFSPRSPNLDAQGIKNEMGCGWSEECYLISTTPEDRVIKIPVKYLINEKRKFIYLPFSYPTLLWIQQRLINKKNDIPPDNPLEVMGACSSFLKHRDIVWEVYVGCVINNGRLLSSLSSTTTTTLIPPLHIRRRIHNIKKWWFMDVLTLTGDWFHYDENIGYVFRRKIRGDFVRISEYRYWSRNRIMDVLRMKTSSLKRDFGKSYISTNIINGNNCLYIMRGENRLIHFFKYNILTETVEKIKETCFYFSNNTQLYKFLFIEKLNVIVLVYTTLFYTDVKVRIYVLEVSKSTNRKLLFERYYYSPGPDFRLEILPYKETVIIFIDNQFYIFKDLKEEEKYKIEDDNLGALYVRDDNEFIGVYYSDHRLLKFYKMKLENNKLGREEEEERTIPISDSNIFKVARKISSQDSNADWILIDKKEVKPLKEEDVWCWL